ncbi:MAG TPA: alpha/beta fold hydrolase [Acidimicrobiales bacterium]|nr:alpha/beta fold hydrolase [Acidimicrobiales bacterium]
MDRVLERDGVQLHYEVHGEGRAGLPLLLTHGYGASTAMWRPNLEALAAARPVIAWDIRGHGRTAAPPSPEHYSQDASVADMAAILDACGITRAAIGGLSLGGYLSLAFHLAWPGRVAALLLFDTGPGYKNDEGRDRWNRYAISRAKRLEEEGSGALGDSPETRLARHDPVGLALAARGILTQHDPAVINSLPEVAVPTLVLVGERDEGFLAASDYMASRIPGAHKVVIPDAGHAANIDQPEAFNDAVTRFLADLA